jgi:hypothetical protein
VQAMRLYHYLSYEHGLSAISANRVKLSRILEMNDPFEHIAISFRDAADRKFMHEHRRSLHEMWGYVCLSEHWRSSIMWSHYAQTHSGIVLGFDVNSAMRYNIEYSRKRVDGPELMRRVGGNPTNAHSSEFLTKHHDWVYEKEHKLACAIDGPEIMMEVIGGRKMYFRPFGADLVLKQVFVGEFAEEDRTMLNFALEYGKHDIQPIQTRLANKSFQVVCKGPAARSRLKLTAPLDDLETENRAFEQGE